MAKSDSSQLELGVVGTVCMAGELPVSEWGLGCSVEGAQNTGSRPEEGAFGPMLAQTVDERMLLWVPVSSGCGGECRRTLAFVCWYYWLPPLGILK